ncbi:hypothetical protein A2765_02525 [Candidatus Kaiserbacteria bacterium RIFCSPHIGHO2_01_FULL_56_24]|uniref:Uncharacterized protein n=1 Tax=Candidatus Kaiserbacteria bacterium RIFCSPHIGHO2_01_FULL_56_24 TaxID=1798487 RepID=A0A1F6DAZ3_9BACT|nr:MAG: hypothetical protein A2765_02525 [Candidatus Kaiserbacteria bacterium RIFCSPHIGHO2_01_FULL_56_24]
MRFDTNIQLKLRDAYAARHEPEAARFLARVYWAFLIVTLAMVVVLSILYGVWEFMQAPQRDESVTGLHAQQVFTRAQLDTVLQGFDARAARFQTRMTAPVSAKDPSQ